jgi:hypothetical protein
MKRLASGLVQIQLTQSSLENRMTEVPQKAIIEVGTGIVRYVPFTQEEIQQRELDAIAFATAEAERKAEEDAKADAKASAQAKLAALGLTGEEITAIL